MKILVIEDDYALNDLIVTRLKEENFQVDYSYDGLKGYLKGLDNTYDLIILDIMLPNKDGFSILKDLRGINIDSKIIILSAKSELEDKLNGLNGGADDYITKPFHMDELLARINILLKRKNKDILKYKDLELDLRKSILRCITTEKEINLICKELKLLEYFFLNPNQIIEKENIYNKVWIDSEINSNTTEVYLTFIRKKLKAIGSNVNIKSLRNLGYRME